MSLDDDVRHLFKNFSWCQLWAELHRKGMVGPITGAEYVRETARLLERGELVEREGELWVHDEAMEARSNLASPRAVKRTETTGT